MADIKNLVRQIIDKNAVFSRNHCNDKGSLIEKNYIVVNRAVVDKNISDTIEQWIFRNGRVILENSGAPNGQIFDVDKFGQNDILLTLVGPVDKSGRSTREFKIRFNNQEEDDPQGELYDLAVARAESVRNSANSTFFEKVGEFRGKNTTKSKEGINMNYLQSLLANQGNE